MTYDSSVRSGMGRTLLCPDRLLKPAGSEVKTLLGFLMDVCLFIVYFFRDRMLHRPSEKKDSHDAETQKDPEGEENQ